MPSTTNNSASVLFRLAKTTSVVVLKVGGRYTLLMDPGLNRPWRGQGIFGEKMGDTLAKDAEANGISAKRMSWEDAYTLLLKQEGGEGAIEKALMDRLTEKQVTLQNPTPKRIPGK